MPRDFRFLDVQAELFRPVQLNRNQVVQGNFAFNGMARSSPALPSIKLLPIWPA